jgi:hypothetical protein
MCVKCNQFVSPENSVRIDVTEMQIMETECGQRMRDERLPDVGSFSLWYEARPIRNRCCIPCLLTLVRVIDICYADLSDMRN